MWETHKLQLRICIYIAPARLPGRPPAFRGYKRRNPFAIRAPGECYRGPAWQALHAKGRVANIGEELRHARDALLVLESREFGRDPEWRFDTHQLPYFSLPKTFKDPHVKQLRAIVLHMFQ
jgi:hypothetical protein